ncbi:MAG: hypothetical protein IKO63_07805, partial [Paludibacteraceae bacterium]|nr:hypothetical protein [Paludibacteraceae bacterium]
VVLCGQIISHSKETKFSTLTNFPTRDGMGVLLQTMQIFIYSLPIMGTTKQDLLLPNGKIKAKVSLEQQFLLALTIK